MIYPAPPPEPRPKKPVAPIARTAVKKRNAARNKRDFVRCYGSHERVEWIQWLPCAGCGRRPSENAHTITGGKGRKADANTIAPLCGDVPWRQFIGCHTKYDRHLPPFDTEKSRALVKIAATEYDRVWKEQDAN